MRTDRLSWIALAVSAFLLGANFWLLTQNRALRAELAAERVATFRQYDLDVGTQFDPLTGLGYGGEEITVSYGAGGRPTLLLLFAPGCGVCDQTWPDWQELVGSLPAGAVQIVAIDMFSESDATIAARLQRDDVLWVRELDPRHKVAYSLLYVPQSILLDADGRVAALLTGHATEQEMNDLREHTLELSQAAPTE